MGVKEKLQGRSYQMSKGTEMVNTEGAENVPPGIGFPRGCGSRGMGTTGI